MHAFFSISSAQSSYGGEVSTFLKLLNFIFFLQKSFHFCRKALLLLQKSSFTSAARRPGEEEPLRLLRAAPDVALPSLPPLLWLLSAAAGAEPPSAAAWVVSLPSRGRSFWCVVAIFFQVTAQAAPSRGNLGGVQKSRPYAA